MSTVRPAHSDDRSAWETLYRGYADFYQIAMTDEILDAVWGWIMDADKAFYCQVAEQDGNLIGLMHYRAMPSPLRGCEVGFLDDLFITPAQRGSGVVDALFAALEADAARYRWPLVRWITADDNHRARKAYERLAKLTPWRMYQLDVHTG